MSEAKPVETRFGLAPEGAGWFVVDARDARWRDFGPLGVACDFEGKRPFPQLGINLNRLLPGQPMTIYHRQLHQEGFLVLAGECLLLVNGEERPLKVRDFFYCPGGTAHAIVGAATGRPSFLRSALAAVGKESSTSPRAQRSRITPPSSKRRTSTPTPTPGFRTRPERCGEDWLPER